MAKLAHTVGTLACKRTFKAAVWSLLSHMTTPLPLTADPATGLGIVGFPSPACSKAHAPACSRRLDAIRQLKGQGAAVELCGKPGRT